MTEATTATGLEGESTEQAATDPLRRDLGVALSGGGHRASLFSLGALLYLVDSGANREVTTISSVSGGTITSAFVAQKCDFRSVESSAFWNVASQLASAIATRGAVSLSSWMVRGYFGILAVLALLVAAICWKAWPLDLPWWGCVALILLWGTLVLFRGVVAGWLLGRAFFVHEDGRPTRLAALQNRTVDHVICATDLTSAAPFYFFCGKKCAAYSPLYGRALAGSTALRTAVRASAALPGAISPKLVWSHRLKWIRQSGVRKPPPELAAIADDTVVKRPPWLLVLADGGVWNNLGTQYFERDMEPGDGPVFTPVKPSVPHEAPPNDDPGKLLIVDGSGGVQPIPAWHLLLPFWAEVLGLARVMGLMYANTVRPRMRQIGESQRSFWRWGDQFDRDWDTPRVGVSISFQDNPQGGRIYGSLGPETDYMKTNFLRRLSSWDEYMAREVPEVICPSLDGFPKISELAATCAEEKTHLSTVDTKTAVALLVYGYFATMRAMSITHGTALVKPFPREARFIELVSGGSQASGPPDS